MRRAIRRHRARLQELRPRLPDALDDERRGHLELGWFPGRAHPGRHFTEANVDAVITLFCRSDEDIEDLRQEGRTVWSGKQLEILAMLAARESLSLDDKLQKAKTAIRANNVFLPLIPDNARYAGTPRSWGT